jgi:hypothetical protein
LTKRFRLDGEGSNGDLGLGGKIGTTFLYSEGTSLYMNYALENERTDNGLQVRQGNLTSGMKKRLTDSSSVYVEERYQDGGTQTGLTHSMSVNLVAREKWNFGANGEFGLLRDAQTFAETNRKAAGLRLGYGTERMQLSCAVKFRNDNAEQLDTTHTKRTAFLFRNSAKVQLTLPYSGRSHRRAMRCADRTSPARRHPCARPAPGSEEQSANGPCGDHFALRYLCAGCEEYHNRVGAMVVP